MIQRATREHIDMLSVAGVKVLNDLPRYASVKVDPEHTKGMLTAYLDVPVLGIFFKEVEGEVVGLFMGCVAAPWFSPEKEMDEIMYWVREDHRTTNLAVRLLNTAEAWAKSLGAKRVNLASASGYETERVVRFYNYLGYKTSGTQCCKEI